MDGLLASMMFGGGSSSSTNIKWILKTYYTTGTSGTAVSVGSVPSGASFAIVLGTSIGFSNYAPDSTLVPYKVSQYPVITVNGNEASLSGHESYDSSSVQRYIGMNATTVKMRSSEYSSKTKNHIALPLTVLLAFGIET